MTLGEKYEQYEQQGYERGMTEGRSEMISELLAAGIITKDQAEKLLAKESK